MYQENQGKKVNYFFKQPQKKLFLLSTLKVTKIDIFYYQ